MIYRLPMAKLPRLLTAAEVAELIGTTRQGIYDRVHRGTIPAIKLGGSLRFDADEITAWINQGRRPAH